MTSPDHQRGMLLAICSVALVSIAQLLLKYGAAQFPHALLSHVDPELLASLFTPGIILPLAAGMLCYGSSVLCWIGALGRLPLSLAYPLLSLSYPLVYLGATWLPWFHETLNAQRLGGIALIMSGVALLMWKARRLS